MYRKILLAYDGSNDGRQALAEAADLAALSKAEIVVFSVVDAGLDVAVAGGVATGTVMEEQIEETQKILGEGLAELKTRGISATTNLAAGHPGERIAALAREINADLIVLGHRQHGLWARWTGQAVGAFLLGDPPCSLLICTGPQK